MRNDRFDTILYEQLTTDQIEKYEDILVSQVIIYQEL